MGRPEPGQPMPAPEGAFVNSIPGMKTAPVEHVIRAKTRENMAKTPEAFKLYNDLARSMRIVNRATKGPEAGKPFCCRVNGEMWPEGADNDYPETWLQPGEYMDVPKDVGLHICGNVWDPKMPDKQDIILRYGDFQYQETPWGTASGRMPKMVRAGLPPLPDLAVSEIDGRHREKGGWKCIVDLYLKGERIGDVSMDSLQLAAEPEEHFELVKA